MTETPKKIPRRGSLDWFTRAWEEGGEDAIRRLMETNPSAYFKIMTQIVRRIIREQDKYARRKAKLKT